MSAIKNKIKVVSDFPIRGVSFKDITPILEDEILFKQALTGMADLYNQH